ncbi:putative protein kinase [Aspergillus nomiae NRRL 13137]|uniref:Protein kinase domain-containing protein n=1 Tax=Aspergillus nomiae NRRL (strain ATCC 15546 / NRRL 13137 / CBS 260.88 / M93) TaxID=1509407 RepID=A0A0L1J6V1_ASPN3|nr:putative protein kinase [Aspergillus nomiae NRRL 13137]KNG87541.1 putative protein kinase [Aspergillus nomiae NRRL 13137]
MSRLMEDATGFAPQARPHSISGCTLNAYGAQWDNVSKCHKFHGDQGKFKSFWREHAGKAQDSRRYITGIPMFQAMARLLLLDLDLETEFINNLSHEPHPLVKAIVYASPMFTTDPKGWASYMIRGTYDTDTPPFPLHHLSSTVTENMTDRVMTGVLTVKLAWLRGLKLPDVAGDTWKKQWRPYGLVDWEAWYRPFKFDLPPSLSSSSGTEEQEGVLTLSLLIRRHKPDTGSTLSLSGEPFGPQCMSLGLVRLNPFLAGAGTQKVKALDGTGGWKYPTPGKKFRLDGNLVYVQKQDSGRSYGMEITHIPRSAHEQLSGENEPVINSLRAGIQHPFIAPLMFAFHCSDGRLELLSQLGSGGYLADHVQRERRFGITKARYYAAELICILEYLHAKNIILGSLKMENILLDSSGHVSLCKPSLFALDLSKDTDCIAPGTSAYQAPEILLNKREPSRASDWWSLGIILYELLTGAPPFYHKDEEERRYRIINVTLQQPVGLPSSTNDILTKLLDKDLTRRLGADGLAEVKAHPFFHGLDWGDCIQRKLETPFKPHNDAVVFWSKPHTDKAKQYPKGELREFDGAVYEILGTSDFPLPRYIGPAAPDTSSGQGNTGTSNEQWELIWVPDTGELYFQNRSSGQRVLARRDTAKRGEIPPPVMSEHPTQRQLEEALAAALQTGYSHDVFSQLISYDLNLNIRINDFKHSPSRWITLLEWAVEQERPDLVHLFLDHGVDADFTVPSQEGPAVVRAVRRKLHNLVEALLQRTAHRVSRTRALALAVEQQDISLATILLSHGVACDFKEADRPLPPDPYHWDYDSNLDRVFEPVDFTPPLVRAARLGDLALVTLLLEHGADPNVAYHVLGGWRGTEQDLGFNEIALRDSRIPTMFSCGRAVQIAMEMGHPELVRALLDAGADIDLPQPAWAVPGHVCQPVPRAAYLEIVSGLRDIVAERRRGINLGGAGSARLRSG